MCIYFLIYSAFLVQLQTDACISITALSISSAHHLLSLCKTHAHMEGWADPPHRTPAGLPESLWSAGCSEAAFSFTCPRTRMHTGWLCFGLQCSGAFSSRPLSLRYTALFVWRRSNRNSPPCRLLWLFFFCPRLLLAAVSECVVGKCADLIGRLKKAVQQSDEEELENDFN